MNNRARIQFERRRKEKKKQQNSTELGIWRFFFFQMRVLKVRLPVDGVTDARDESGQEHERFPVRSFFTGHPTYVAVRPRVTLYDTADINGEQILPANVGNVKHGRNINHDALGVA